MSCLKQAIMMVLMPTALLAACSSPGALTGPTAAVTNADPTAARTGAGLRPISSAPSGTAPAPTVPDRQMDEVTPTVTQPTPAPDGLGGTEWLLTSLDGRRPVKDTRITLEFNNGVIEGQSGCNYYGATYEATQGRLKLSRLGISDMACPEPAGVMEQEAAYTRLLLRAANYRVSGDRLEIQDKRGKTLLVYSRDI